MSERKHRSTGKKPPGGKRPGAGRPPGSRSDLEYGEVKATKALRHRVPEGTRPELAEVADLAFGRIVDVMNGAVWEKQAGHVLKAAVAIREEVCGPRTQRIEHSFEAQTDEQLRARLKALEHADAAKDSPEPENA